TLPGELVVPLVEPTPRIISGIVGLEEEPVHQLQISQVDYPNDLLNFDRSKVPIRPGNKPYLNPVECPSCLVKEQIYQVICDDPNKSGNVYSVFCVSCLVENYICTRFVRYALANAQDTEIDRLPVNLRGTNLSEV